MSRPAPVRWQSSLLDELSAQEVHDVLRLRQQVFILEQDCLFGDIDGRDPFAWHLLGWIEQPPTAAPDATRVTRAGGSAATNHAGSAGRPLLAAYARIFEPGALAREAVIGRVVTAPRVRGAGLGRALMDEAIRLCEMIAPGQPIRVAAQERVVEFYDRLGFRPTDEPYLEDGIRHQDMVRTPDDATE